MKIAQNRTTSRSAYALVTVMVMAAVSMLLFASIANWGGSSAIVNDRNNVYNSAVEAAEGATENVLGYLARDFANQSYDPANLDAYRALVPTNAWATRYEFRDGLGGINLTRVTGSAGQVLTNLDSQFAGLYGMTYSCTVCSEAKTLNSAYNITAAVQQQLQLAAIPLFQFMIFYSMDLEINPGPAMKATGKVFSNGSIYTAPVTSLEYCDDVLAVGRIYNNRMSDDPTVAGKVAPVYDVPPVEHVSSLTLPIGTNNSPAAVRAILQPSPIGENASSLLGHVRYYNNVDLIVTTTPTNVTVKAGRWDGFLAQTPDVAGTTNTPAHFSFIKTNATFFDAREGKNTVVTDIDVAALAKWMTNAAVSLNAAAQVQLGHKLNSIYVNDLRTNGTKLTVVRVSNGQKLPPSGLTVATPLPLYVQGHFNAPITTPGSTNTTNALPASLVGDAITVLSGAWADTNSNKSLSNRDAADTTVNAAFLSGIVQTTNVSGVKHYSGGVENFPRFLEDWGGKTFTYNGSMVVMFPSQFATSFWIDPGTYYQAPTRKWAFDVNFLNYNKLPPATPQVRKLVRGYWNVVAAQ